MRRSSHGFPRRYLIGIAFASVLLPSRSVWPAELKKETLLAWEQYVRLTEARVYSEYESDRGFLAHEFLPASDASRDRQSILSGQVFIRKLQTRNEEGKKIDIPKGLVHHWLGGILIRDAKLDEVVMWAQNYDDREKYFKEVEQSQLISRDGDVFRIFLRLRRTRVKTVHYNTEHVVEYRKHGTGKASSKSETARIAQLENPGTAEEREKPVGRDSGYLWRWNSYWRFKQEPEGVVVECESISLSRAVPAAMAWFINPFVRSVPKESLAGTLESMRDALSRS